MERDLENLDKGNGSILCTKLDGTAGNWPSESFIELFVIAHQCLNAKMYARPEMAEVTVQQRSSSYILLPHTLPLMTESSHPPSSNDLPPHILPLISSHPLILLMTLTPHVHTVGLWETDASHD